ncbi:MAG: HD domain-containing protein [Lachnospiraceae bacterium]|nr:HD domain-containing protein [Lachnospiraceae bacterium]
MTPSGEFQLSRKEMIEAAVCDTLSGITSPTERIRASAHLFGTARMAVLIAKKRGLDEELAYLAGLLHDLWSFKTGISAEHGPNGAALAGTLLDQTGLFTKPEREAVCGAIYFHSEKSRRHLPFDELLKDADILDRMLAVPNEKMTGADGQRAKRLLLEFLSRP